MIDKDETFNGSWPFKANFSTVSDFKQHYVDEGPVDGAVLICLHGEPTWGYLYRHMIPLLAKHYRVIVPDHMGFGKSETPQDRNYTLEVHVKNLTALINELELKKITFIGQDWGGPIAGAYALNHPDNVARFCLMNTLLGYGGPLPNKELTPWFQWIEKHHIAGTLDGVLGELGSYILSIIQIISFEKIYNEIKLLTNFGIPEDTYKRAMNDDRNNLKPGYVWDFEISRLVFFTGFLQF